MGRVEMWILFFFVTIFSWNVVDSIDLQCNFQQQATETCNLNASFEITTDINFIAPSNAERFTKVRLMERSTLKRIPAVIFDKLSNVRTVDMSIGAIELISRNSFSSGSKIENLHLYMNDIREIEDFAFELLPELRILRLFSNQLTTIRRATFIGATNLKDLDLHGNRIEVIEDQAFKFPKLLILDLDRNNLKTVTHTMFTGAHMLQRLSLESNHLIRTEKFYVSLNQLRELNLNKNPLKDLNVTALAEMESLENLKLVKTKLNFDRVEVAQTIQSKVKMLDISENNLLDIDLLTKLPKFFPDLEHLVIEGVNSTPRTIDEWKKVFPKMKRLGLAQQQFDWSSWFKVDE